MALRPAPRGRLGAAEEGYAVVIEACSPTTAVDARGGEIGETRASTRMGVGLEGDFDVVVRGPMLEAASSAPQRCRGPSGRSAAAEEDRERRRPGSLLASWRGRRARRCSTPVVDGLPDMAVEFAIGAFATQNGQGRRAPRGPRRVGVGRFLIAWRPLVRASLITILDDIYQANTPAFYHRGGKTLADEALIPSCLAVRVLGVAGIRRDAAEPQLAGTRGSCASPCFNTPCSPPTMRPW